MTIPFGNLYSDFSSLTIEEKIKNFSMRFEEKNGVVATDCEVNPETYKLILSEYPEGEEKYVGKVKITPSRLIAKNHFFVGGTQAIRNKPFENREFTSVQEMGVN